MSDDERARWDVARKEPSAQTRLMVECARRAVEVMTSLFRILTTFRVAVGPFNHILWLTTIAATLQRLSPSCELKSRG